MNSSDCGQEIWQASAFTVLFALYQLLTAASQRRAIAGAQPCAETADDHHGAEERTDERLPALHSAHRYSAAPTGRGI